MTKTPYRLVRPTSEKVSAESAVDAKAYLDRLLKLIPAEVVALYLAGIRTIPAKHRPILWIWIGVCLVVLLLIRAYGTADLDSGVPVQWKAVVISAIAFLIWIFSIGGVLSTYSWYVDYSYTASLSILLYTTVVPIFYRGD